MSRWGALLSKVAEQASSVAAQVSVGKGGWPGAVWPVARMMLMRGLCARPPHHGAHRRST